MPIQCRSDASGCRWRYTRETLPRTAYTLSTLEIDTDSEIVVTTYQSWKLGDLAILSMLLIVQDSDLLIW